MAWLHLTTWAPSPTGPWCRGGTGAGSGALSLGLSAVGLGVKANQFTLVSHYIN